VRHVRMLGLCLAAAFAIGALAAVPALAKNKNGWTASSLTQYEHCPYSRGNPNRPTELFCLVGQTLPGSKGGFFSLGGVTVALDKPITIQGAIHAVEDEEQEILGYETYAPVGAELLESPELKIRGGLNLITPAIQEQVHWPQALKELFKEAKKNKETQANVKIEVAGGNLVYETPNSLDPQNLIEEEGSAFILPLKTKVTSPLLARLGGGPCQIGNDEHPIMQYLTSENPGWSVPSGKRVEFANGNETLEVSDSKLVDTNWPVEAASGATGCGGEYESYIDEAINKVLGVGYGYHGITVLEGNLWEARSDLVKEHFEG
jgi:hypothetical protein